MFPRSKFILAFLVAVPLLLFGWMWQLAQKRPRLVGAFNSPVAALALSRDGTLLAAASGDGSVGILPQGQSRFLPLQTERTTPGKPGTAISAPAQLQFSPDQQTIFGFNVHVGTTSTSRMYAWDAQTRSIKWSLVSQYDDDFCQFWPSVSGKSVTQRSYDIVKTFDVSGAGTPVSSNRSKFARSFPVLARFQARVLLPGGGYIFPQTAALSPDEKTMVVATPNAQLEFWDVGTGKRQFQTPVLSRGGAAGHGKLLYSPDGRFVALFDGSNISLWDITARQWTSATVSSTTIGPAASLAWMPNSRSFWTGSGSIQQWSAPQLKILREIPVSGPMAVSGDGNTLATAHVAGGGIRNGVWLWNIA